MKNGEGTRKRLKIVSFFNAISVVCGQWRVVMECKTELLDQLWLVYREFYFTWQERESLESTWIRPLEVRDGNAVSVLWSLMFVFEAQYTGVLWRLLVQNKRIIVVRELINGNSDYDSYNWRPGDLRMDLFIYMSHSYGTYGGALV
ncbi:hypothetical protein YC2023_094516 [Brassica napus]